MNKNNEDIVKELKKIGNELEVIRKELQLERTQKELFKKLKNEIAWKGIIDPKKENPA